MRNIRWAVAMTAFVVILGLSGEAQAARCPVWMCGTNSPVAEGAPIEQPTPAALRAVRQGRVQSLYRDILCFFLLCDEAPSGVGCPVWMCGTNSPVVDGAVIEESMPPAAGRAGCPTLMCRSNSLVAEGAAIEYEGKQATADRSFHELNMHGLPNAAGFSVLAAHKGAVTYTLEGYGAGVAGRPLEPGAPRLEGAALVGLVLVLRDSANRRYTVHVAATNATIFWAQPHGSVRTYALTYAPEGASASQPLCTAGANEAILFQGDRYDSQRKTIVATGAAAKGWVNIGCAGTSIAKLYLTRHTQASQQILTTPGERQSMLKMFTADVCGDGTSFTVPGQRLLWADAKGITTFASPAATVEAIWNESGAVCLNTPRQPKLAPAIAARCPRPSCGEATSPTGRGHVISAIPR